MGMKYTKVTKVKEAYNFFCKVEDEKVVFTLQELMDVTGWGESTVKTYLNKKWQKFVTPQEHGYVCKGIKAHPEETFIQIHSQKTDPFTNVLRPQFTPVVDTLIDKSREAAMLAIQTYNNPFMSFRVHGFIVQMIIAYTSLFHAIFERKATQYWYLESNGTPKKIDGDLCYWELSSCIKEYYHGQNTPETSNLKMFIRLRNKIEHRFAPVLDSDISGYCQALLLNFEKLLIKEFGEYFALGQHLAIALQLSEYSPQHRQTLHHIQAQQYKEVRDFIHDYRHALPEQITQSQNFCFRAFLIPIIGNHRKNSDVTIEFVKYDPDNPEEMAMYDKQVAFIREKQIQVADQGKLIPKKVVALVKQRTGIDFSINDHTKAWKLNKIRTTPPKPETCNIQYCQYSEAFSQVVYTQAWVDFLCEKIQDTQEFEKIKTYRSATIDSD